MPQKRKILLLDTGKEWGGGTNSMLELLKEPNQPRQIRHYLLFLQGL